MDHHSAIERLEEGRKAEYLFVAEWGCLCGADFSRNDTQVPHNPDFACKQCGCLVDVKSPALWTGGPTITISQVALDSYPPELIIALWTGLHWIGCIRRKVQIVEGPCEPTHKERGTWFYKIRMNDSQPDNRYWGWWPAEQFFRRKQPRCTCVWVDAGRDNRSWIRTECSECEKFVGFRPPEKNHAITHRADAG